MSYSYLGVNWIFSGQKLTFVSNSGFPESTKKSCFSTKSRECEFSWWWGSGSGAVLLQESSIASLTDFWPVGGEKRSVTRPAFTHTAIVAALPHICAKLPAMEENSHSLVGNICSHFQGVVWWLIQPNHQGYWSQRIHSETSSRRRDVKLARAFLVARGKTSVNPRVALISKHI